MVSGLCLQESYYNVAPFSQGSRDDIKLKQIFEAIISEGVIMCNLLCELILGLCFKQRVKSPQT